MRPRPIYHNPNEAGFLGLFEGNRRKRIIEAETAAKAKLEEEKRKTLAAELEAAKQGYNPAKEAANAAVTLENAKQEGDKSLYYVIGAIVVAVMIGLYFIKRK